MSAIEPAPLPDYDLRDGRRLEVLESSVEQTFKRLSSHIHGIAREKGFYEKMAGYLNRGERIALIHSEASELLEADRKSVEPDKHCPEFPNHAIEMADIIIRVLDKAHAEDVDIGAAIVAKCRANAKRPYKHGKKF